MSATLALVGYLPLASRCLSVVAPGSSQVLFISGYKTCEQIKQNGTTGQLPALPFISTYVCCIVWALYGILVRDAIVFLSNASANPSQLRSYLVGSFAFVMFSIVVAAISPLHVAEKMIGMEGSVMAVVMIAAPLSVIKTVVKERNTDALPFYPALAGWINGICWTSYGLFVVHNPTIYTPNAICLACTTVQMLLFAWIHFTPPSRPNQEGEGGSSKMDDLDTQQPLMEREEEGSTAEGGEGDLEEGGTLDLSSSKRSPRRGSVVHTTAPSSPPDEVPGAAVHAKYT